MYSIHSAFGNNSNYEIIISTFLYSYPIILLRLYIHSEFLVNQFQYIIVRINLSICNNAWIMLNIMIDRYYTFS